MRVAGGGAILDHHCRDGNYFEMFDGLITPEQTEGLRLLVTPFQTTWFNVTHHRVTEQPSQGVSCFSCHVNGHTNAAFELAPDSRPNYARLRVDTPSMRECSGHGCPRCLEWTVADARALSNPHRDVRLVSDVTVTRT